MKLVCDLILRLKRMVIDRTEFACMRAIVLFRQGRNSSLRRIYILHFSFYRRTASQGHPYGGEPTRPGADDLGGVFVVAPPASDDALRSLAARHPSTTCGALGGRVSALLS